MKNNFFKMAFLLTISTVIFTMVNFVIPVEADPQVEILSHSSFIDSFESYIVVGEVQNTGDEPLEYVWISATFYDSNNTVVETESTFTIQIF